MKKMSLFLVVAVIGLFGFSCNTQVYTKRALTNDQIANITIPSPVQGSPMITLKNGKFDATVGEGRWQTHLSFNLDAATTGDLNGDGQGDLVALGSYSTGGTGFFTDLFVFLNVNGQPQFTAATTLGDRIQVDANSISVVDSIISADIITQGPGEPMCCGTMHKYLHYRLVDHSLIEVKPVGTSETK